MQKFREYSVCKHISVNELITIYVARILNSFATITYCASSWRFCRTSRKIGAFDRRRDSSPMSEYICIISAYSLSDSMNYRYYRSIRLWSIFGNLVWFVIAILLKFSLHFCLILSPPVKPKLDRNTDTAIPVQMRSNKIPPSLFNHL